MSLSGACKSFEELIHGVIVRDPFRWLENGSSIETRAWITDQRHRYDRYFGRSEELDVVRERVREYLDVKIVDQPARIAGQYFFRRRDKGREQGSIYVRDVSTGRERLLVDATSRNKFSSVGIHCISIDGSLLAYELKHGGTDLLEIHVINVLSGLELPDVVEEGYPRGFTFASDGDGFYYCQETVKDLCDHTIRFHRLGDVGSDEIIYRASRSTESRLLLISDATNLGALYSRQSNGGLATDLSIAGRETPSRWSCVSFSFNRDFRPFLKSGRIFAVSSNGTQNGRLIELDKDGREIRVIIPEQAQEIKHLLIADDHVVVTSLREWGMVANSWNLAGEYIGGLEIPQDGTIRLFQSPGTDSVFCTYESFNEPPTTYEYFHGALTQWHKRQAPSGRGTCTSTSLSVPSKDGTPVPVILTSQSNSKTLGPVPVIMTGYGGFGTSVTPEYSVLVSMMMEVGCTFVLVRIRGGGEFGSSWQEQGRRAKRQNSFDDFIAVAEWLSAVGIATPEKLAIVGGSNAGLLMGAILTQRPELIGAVVCIAPLLDMVRYEKFDQAARWRSEYGSVELPEDFRALHAYSPYHRVQDTYDYPPVLFISGDRDERCNPAHVRKMAARLQQRNSQSRPILVDYNPKRGHSAVLPLGVRIESLSRRIAFLCQELRIPITGDAQ